MRISLLSGLVVIFLLPLIGAWVRRTHENRCAFDGEGIQPIYRVRISDEANQNHDFCSVECASHWLEREKLTPKEILVTDEQSGQEIPAAVAFFVRSSIVTMPVSGNRVHVFRNRVDAERHSQVWKGPILNGSEIFRSLGAQP